MRRDSEMTCRKCDFFFRKGRGTRGECRRFPPTMTAGPMRPAEAPQVDGMFWCGEFQRTDSTGRHLGRDSLASALMMMDD